MQYTHLKQYFDKFIQDNPNPYPLRLCDGYTSDVRKTIQNNIDRIEAVENLKSKGVHHAAKNNLIKIHAAIQLNDQSEKPIKTSFENF